MILRSKDVLGLEDLTAEEILGVIDIASRFRAVFDRPVRSVPIMRGRTVVNFFHEPSTRTRISFELAEKRLSADIVNFSTARRMACGRPQSMITSSAARTVRPV